MIGFGRADDWTCPKCGHPVTRLGGWQRESDCPHCWSRLGWDDATGPYIIEARSARARRKVG